MSYTNHVHTRTCIITNITRTTTLQVPGLRMPTLLLKLCPGLLLKLRTGLGTTTGRGRMLSYVNKFGNDYTSTIWVQILVAAMGLVIPKGANFANDPQHCVVVLSLR